MRTDLQRLKRDSESGKSAAESPVAKPKSISKMRRNWLVAAIVLLVALAAVGLWRWRTAAKSGASQIESIAVIPFSSTGGNADTDFLSDGITESLIDSLTHVPDLKVKSRNSVFRYKGKEFDAQQVGKELTVDALLTGRVVQHGDTIQVSADLTNVADNTEIWGEHYEGKSADILSLQQQIAGDIADKLRSKLTGAEKQQVSKQGTQNPEAYQLYVKGRYYWNKRTNADVKTSITYFNQAIDKDPNYALAYAGIADAYAVLSDYGADPNDVFPKSSAAAEKALELDPSLARPHADLGSYKMQHAWDFAGGEAEFRKAFELDPSDASAHQWFAEQLSYIGGRAQESIDEAERARQLDPLSPVIITVLAEVCTQDRQFDRSIEILNKFNAENPSFGRGHFGLYQSYWGKHEYAQAIRELKTSAQLEGDKDAAEIADAMDTGFRSGGLQAAMRKAIEVALARRKSSTNFVSSFQIASFYAELGDKDRAFDWLNTAYQERDNYLEALRTTYWMDSLRSDPRYSALVRKIGFPQ